MEAMAAMFVAGGAGAGAGAAAGSTALAALGPMGGALGTGAAASAAAASTGAVGAAAGSAGLLAAGGGAAGGAGLFSGIGSALSGLSAGDYISGGLSGLSAISSIQSGRVEGQTLDMQAELLGLQGEQEELEGRRTALRATEELNDILNRNLAAGYGSGLRSSGSVAQASTDAKISADFSRDLTQSGARVRSAAKQTEAAIARRRGSSARQTGVTDALSRVADVGMRYIDRG